MTTPPSPHPRSSPLKPILVIGIVLIALATVVVVSKSHQSPELVPWTSDYPAAVARARSSNKPILLYFTASWCGPCQEMRRYVWTDPQVAEAVKPFIPVRLDVDHEPALAKQYRIEGMPTFILLTPDNHIGKLTVGAMDSDQMIAWLGKN